MEFFCGFFDAAKLLPIILNNVDLFVFIVDILFLKKNRPILSNGPEKY